MFIFQITQRKLKWVPVILQFDSLKTTSNDAVIDRGAIIAGVLVYPPGSNKPDLIVGTIVFLVVGSRCDEDFKARKKE